MAGSVATERAPAAEPRSVIGLGPGGRSGSNGGLVVAGRRQQWERMRMVTEVIQPVGDSGPEVAGLVASRVADVPDFPQQGVLFKDLTPLFADGTAFRAVVDAISGYHAAGGFDVVVGIEARGFVIAAAVAYAAGVGVVPVRKAGKLPRPAFAAAYGLEYGEAVLELHEDAFLPGQRVLVVDDVLATGGTAEATLGLVERAGGTVAGFSVLLELSFLAGRERLAGRPVHALLVV